MLQFSKIREVFGYQIKKKKPQLNKNKQKIKKNQKCLRKFKFRQNQG